MDSNVVFAHERLVVFQRATEFSAIAAGILRGLPRGEAALADQLRRGADSVLLNIAEGASRSAGADKARFYDFARGSAGECAAVCSALASRGLAADLMLERARRVLHEVVRMLTALARNARHRAGSG